MLSSMRRIIKAAIFFGIFGLSIPAVSACWCFVPNVPKSFNKAADVFVGIVTDIKLPLSFDEKAPFADRLFTIRFKVEKSWKGSHALEISVLADQGLLSCFSYRTIYIGDRYLVYADPLSSNENDRSDLVMISSCNRTGPVGEVVRPSLSFAFDDWLGRRYLKKEPKDWLGRVYRDEDLTELEEIRNTTLRVQFNQLHIRTKQHNSVKIGR